MKKKYITSIVFGALLPLLVFADTFTGISNPLVSDDYSAIINNIISFLQKFGVAVVVIMIFVGAFQMLSSGGDSKKVTSGRGTLYWAAAGFAILTLASIIKAALEELLK